MPKPQGRKRRMRHDKDELWRRRTAAGLEQADLARMAGCTQPHISDMERGARGPSIPLLRRLADALNCEITDLMPREGSSNSEPEENSNVQPGEFPVREAS